MSFLETRMTRHDDLTQRIARAGAMAALVRVAACWGAEATRSESSGLLNAALGETQPT